MKIVYQDDDLLIVEKPEGISTQPLTSPSTPSLARRGQGGGLIPSTLAEMLAEQYPELKKVGGSDWGAVHRLDRETSGLVIFARHQQIYEKMRAMFSKNQVRKEYVAWVEGRIEKKGKISWPIGPDPKSSKRVKVYKNIREARRNKAQEAVTIYEPIDVGATHRGCPELGRPQGAAPTTLLQIYVKTGCRHQIRAHLAAIGHPIVGDSLYGGPPSKRMMLHAARLAFKHPRTGTTIQVWSGKDNRNIPNFSKITVQGDEGQPLFLGHIVLKGVIEIQGKAG